MFCTASNKNRAYIVAEGLTYAKDMRKISRRYNLLGNSSLPTHSPFISIIFIQLKSTFGPQLFRNIFRNNYHRNGGNYAIVSPTDVYAAHRILVAAYRRNLSQCFIPLRPIQNAYLLTPFSVVRKNGNHYAIDVDCSFPILTT